jgi:hypothetical protein
MKPPTGDLTTDVAHAIVGFPKALATWVLGLVYAVCTDTAVQTFTVAGGVTGFLTNSILAGLLVFFVLHSLGNLTRAVNEALLGASTRVGNNVASVMLRSMQEDVPPND